MNQQPAAVPAINSVSDSIGFPFRDPQWVSKVLVQGLINGGLNFSGILATIRANTNTALMAGLFSFLLYVIAGFGQIACFVGFYFTLAWAMAGLAAVAYWEERNLRPAGEAMQSPQSMPPPPSIPPPPSA